MPSHFNRELDIGNNLALLGFETKIAGDCWNVDIWWKDKSEIDDFIVYTRDMIRLMHERPE